MALHPFCTLLCIAFFFTLHAPFTSPAPTLHRLLLPNNNNNHNNINTHKALHSLILANSDDTSGNDGGRINNDSGDIIKLYGSDAHAEDDRSFTSSSNRGISGSDSSIKGPNYKNESQDLTLSSSISCDPTYGVMPCSDSVLGNIFLMAAYGFLLFTSAKMLSEGSELLLTVLDAGIIGGLLLPILGALPDSILILVSGLGGTTSEAQEQVLVGIGLLAGSIVMLLTLLWGSCLILGRCDLEVDDNSGKTKAVDKKLSKSFGLTDTGVEIDELTQLSARIMIISVVFYIVAQLPRMFSFSTNGNIPVLIAGILAILGLLAYCLYQVFTPFMQQRRKDIAQRRIMKFVAIEKLMKRQGEDERLVDEGGNLNQDYAQRLFQLIDRNRDGIVSKDELRAMLTVSMKHDQGKEELINHLMEEFDENKNENISQEEFMKGMQKWCSELKIKEKPIAEYRQHAENIMEELQGMEGDDDDDDDGEKKPPSKKQLIRNAVLLLLGGTIIAAVFADPLVDAVDAFSTASSIPSFFVSFVLLPFASNSSEGVSCIMFSARKKKRHSSLTFSQIYGAVTMNSTMGLGVFLSVVYARQLVWDFSSEVTVIVIVTVIMGLMGSFRKVFPLWMSGVALLLYPLSLGLVAVLDYVVGWE